MGSLLFSFCGHQGGHSVRQTAHKETLGNLQTAEPLLQPCAKPHGKEQPQLEEVSCAAGGMLHPAVFRVPREAEAALRLTVSDPLS